MGNGPEEKEFHAEGNINKCRQEINTAHAGKQKQLVWLVASLVGTVQSWGAAGVGLVCWATAAKATKDFKRGFLQSVLQLGRSDYKWKERR